MAKPGEPFAIRRQAFAMRQNALKEKAVEFAAREFGQMQAARTMAAE